MQPRVKPRFRGLSHELAFYLALPLGVALVLEADTGRARAAAIVFAASVAAMFGASSLYHRVDWPDARRLWFRRLDHAGIYALIAGTYTPFGLLVLDGAWRVTMLAIVWTGAAVSIVLKLFWCDGPKWLAAALGIGLVERRDVVVDDGGHVGHGCLLGVWMGAHRRAPAGPCRLPAR